MIYLSSLNSNFLKLVNQEVHWLLYDFHHSIILKHGLWIQISCSKCYRGDQKPLWHLGEWSSQNRCNSGINCYIIIRVYLLHPKVVIESNNIYMVLQSHPFLLHFQMINFYPKTLKILDSYLQTLYIQIYRNNHLNICHNQFASLHLNPIHNKLRLFNHWNASFSCEILGNQNFWSSFYI